MKKLGIDPSTILFIVVAAACAGSIPPFAKVGLEVFGPFTLVMIRFFFASIVLLPLVIKSKDISFLAFKRFWVVGLIGALNPVLVFIGLKFTKASVTPLLYAAIPAMTTIYFGLKGQKYERKQALGIVIGFIGVALIALLPLIENGSLKTQELEGNAIILLAVIAFFIYTLMSKSLQKKYQASPISLTFYFCLTTFLLSIPFSLQEINNHPLINIGLKHILAGVEVGIIGTSIGYVAYQYALKTGSELTASLFTYLQPVSTIFFAAILLGERITPTFIIGGCLALLGAQFALTGQPTTQSKH